MIPTRTSPIKRALHTIGDLCDRHQWIPLVIALIALLIVNSVDAPY